MQRKMEAMTVRTTDDSVIIEQDNGLEDPHGIVLSPDQIPVLIARLEEAPKAFAHPF